MAPWELNVQERNCERTVKKLYDSAECVTEEAL